MTKNYVLRTYEGEKEIMRIDIDEQNYYYNRFELIDNLYTESIYEYDNTEVHTFRKGNSTIKISIYKYGCKK